MKCNFWMSQPDSVAALKIVMDLELLISEYKCMRTDVLMYGLRTM